MGSSAALARPDTGRTVTQSIADVIARRPVLAPVLQAFEPLLAAQSELVEELADVLFAAGLALPKAQGDQEAPRLEGRALIGAAAPLRSSAERLLPLLEGLQALQVHMPALKAFFLRPVAMEAPASEEASRDSRELLAEAIVAGNQEALARIAVDNKLEPLILDFAAGFILSPVLRAMTAQIERIDGEAPWDAGEARQQGRCPVCGALPSIAFLDKPVVDEKNAFLAGGGGKKHLHCGLCGADWKFRRGACPSCGEEGTGVIEILRESGASHGERLDWCTKCKSYCPTLDLRECEFTPNLEAATLGMMHLDMVAARKDLRPLKAAFWNIF